VHVALNSCPHEPEFKSQIWLIICVKTTNAHAIRLISWTGKRVRRCAL